MLERLYIHTKIHTCKQRFRHRKSSLGKVLLYYIRCWVIFMLLDIHTSPLRKWGGFLRYGCSKDYTNIHTYKQRFRHRNSSLGKGLLYYGRYWVIFVLLNIHASSWWKWGVFCVMSVRKIIHTYKHIYLQREIQTQKKLSWKSTALSYKIFG